MSATIFLRCELHEKARAVLADEGEEWVPAENASAAQVPQQGFSSLGLVRRWICTDIGFGFAVTAVLRHCKHSILSQEVMPKAPVDCG